MEVAYVDSQLYEQGMVMSASLKNENSADLGRAKGGAFTYALRMVMANLRDTKPLATLKDLADDTIVKTRREGGHTPVYKAYPSADVLNDFLFLYRTGNEQQPH